KEEIESGKWSVATVDLTPARANRIEGIDPIIQQIHIYPFGDISPRELKNNDIIYISHIIMLKDKPGDTEFHKSYISGYSDKSFGINGNMTRAEACTIIARLAFGSDSRVPDAMPCTFADVTSDKWYYNYIAALDCIGYLDSYNDNFEPEKKITRAEFAELVYALGILTDKGGNGSFTDVPADHKRAELISAAGKAGMINGYDNGNGTYSFKPDNNISRAEVVKMINNAYGRKCNANGMYASVKDYFSDVSSDHWAFADIIDSAIDHISYIGEDGKEMWICAFGENVVAEDFDTDFAGGEKYAKEAEQKLRARIEEIRNTESEYEKKSVSKIFYVSNNGNDLNDASSPEKAIKTVSKLMKMQNDGTVGSGDIVLFERGSEWRERWNAKEGVTYSAYGEGNKPLFNGNDLGNAADPAKWVLTPGTTNIWKYNNHVLDIGNIVYNDGEKTVTKLVPQIKEKTLLVNGEKFDPLTSLTQNDTFICEYVLLGQESVDVSTAISRLYVRCDEGNPGEVYDSIELVYRGNLIRGASNTVFDNICIKYSGSHGIGMGTVYNVTVRNCEVGYIGGSAQYYRGGNMVRFGNGIEIYGGCNNFVIDNCYVYQCYDAGITHQISSGGTNDVIHENVYFTNNVIEKCIYNIEYFMGASENDSAVRRMHNIVYKDNILAYSGLGWGMDPGRSASIKGWNHRNEATDFVIEDNIFLLDRMNACDLGAYSAPWLPSFKGNTYVQKYGNGMTKVGAPSAVQHKFDGYALGYLSKYVHEDEAKVYFVREKTN
ncbi:MAG: S-layer homology domain-containing protein, partial [Clostridia bacterium]|nr:S-layer homology domain-containing protein [Clostridia bacterium]